jgi:predicted dehydrogenase
MTAFPERVRPFHREIGLRSFAMLLTRRASITTLAGAALGAVLPSASAVGAGKIGIGQIGTSHSHAAGKMQAIRSLPDLYEVIGIAEGDEKRRATAAKNKAFAGLSWKSEEELLAAPDVKAIAVELDLDEAAAAAMRAIRAGKHVHLDKPGAAAHATFKAMREEAERRKMTVQMGYMLRYNPAFELLFRAARDGWFGDITEIDASMGKLSPDGHRTILGKYPGGGMFELACHVIDAVVTLLGKPQAVHAFGNATRGPADTFSDNQLAVLEYAKATAVIRCNHADPFGGPRRRFHVAGTKGVMEIEPLESGKATLYLSEPRETFVKGQQSIALKVPADRYASEFRDLARVIRGEKSFAWNAAHDIAVHETALRAAGTWRP